MLMSEWGEDNFIKELKKSFSITGTIQGIGDDCAVIPSANNQAWLVTTDALIENVHFLKNHISAAQLGYKSMMVNLSDIAAMGGIPKFCFLSLAMPSTTEKQWVQEFMQGIRRACLIYGVLLLGGDTTSSPAPVFINIAIIGEVELTKVKYRHTAKPGNLVCVTGVLGDSAAGLRSIIKEIPRSADVLSLIDSHIEPRAHLQEGAWLSNQNAVTAMMDVSDGLAQDLPKLLSASNCGANIYLSHLPISYSLQNVANQQCWDLFELALAGGEDYCLILTVAEEEASKIEREYLKQFGKKIYQVGKLTDVPSELNYYKDDMSSYTLMTKGFNHFT